MSLIQEALKRQAEENASVLPPPIPVEIAELPTEQKKPNLPTIVLLALLTAGVIAVLTGLGIYLIQPKTEAPADQQWEPVAPAAPAAGVAAPQPAVVPAPSVPAAKPEKAEPAAAEPVKAEPVKAEPAKREAPVSHLKWPELRLTGIAQGEKRIAIINDKMLTAGREIGEVTVKEVRDHSVVLEYRGEQRIVYMGE